MKAEGARKWWALGALVLAVLAVGLDGTVLSIAIPTLAEALHASETDLQWFSSGYLLTLAIAMLPAGLAGDRFGRKKVLLITLLLFGGGSAICAYASTPAIFIVARCLLGLAGAGIIVMALSAVTVLFSEQERPRAVGIWGAANFLSLPLGPILGGWLLSHAWWGWVFLLNVPIALLGLLATLALVPESRAPVPPDLDPLGLVTSAGGLALITAGLIRAGSDGWGERAALLPIAGGLLLLGGFFLWEYWQAQGSRGRPLLDFALLRTVSFTWSVVLLAVMVLAMSGLLFTLPQYFQGVLGLDAMGSGVRLLALVGGLVLGSLPADRVARLLGVKVTVALGFALLGGGMLLGAASVHQFSEWLTAAWVALVGFGMGLTFATAAATALSEVPAERSGIASALLQALQKMGGPLGAAVLGSVLNSVYLGKLSLLGLPASLAEAVRRSLFSGLAVAARLHSPTLLQTVDRAFIDGLSTTLIVTAGISGAGVLLALLTLPGRKRDLPPA